jgi:hypothetical protein
MVRILGPGFKRLRAQSPPIYATEIHGGPSGSHPAGTGLFQPLGSI